MRTTSQTNVQTRIAQELALKVKRRFYNDINMGFARSVANALNNAGYIMVVQLGKVEFEKDVSANIASVRSDNIYVPTPLATILAAERATRHLPILKPEGLFA